MSFVAETWAGGWLTSWQPAVLVGVWSGCLHAFDADHLATIGGLAVRDRSLSPTAYALRWSLGHGAALALIATLVLGLGAANAADWAAYAELVVCVALLVIGAQALRTAWAGVVLAGRAAQAGPTLAATGTVPHVHRHAGGRGVAMGLLHGGAGSSAVLALLPLGHFHGLDSAVYVACFSIGVTLGALAFAAVFALCVARSATAGTRLRGATQGAVGALAVASGAWLLAEILRGGG